MGFNSGFKGLIINMKMAVLVFTKYLLSSPEFLMTEKIVVNNGGEERTYLRKR